MSKLLYLTILIYLPTLVACRKNNYQSNKTAAINVFNGYIRNNVLLKMNGSINSSGVNSSNARQSRVSFGGNILFYAESQKTTFEILNAVDTTSIVSTNYELASGGIYTLLLAGIAPKADLIMIDDSNIPYVDPSRTPAEADSVIKIRFINLCPDTEPLDIRIEGNSTNEVTGLIYKNYTPFNIYSAKMESYSGTIIFEVVENGNILKKYSLIISNSNRFKNLAF